jgi:hypothetical protein
MAIEGPYRTFTTKSGAMVPWYVVPFDEEGRCKAPRTRADLVDALRANSFTHVFLFCHGWNNDWADAVSRYDDFVAGFAGMSERQGFAGAPAYKPVLVGLFWPGISLVLPWERAPQFAAAGTAASSAEADQLADAADRSVGDIAARLPDAEVPHFYELANRRELDAAGARQLAALILPLLGGGDEGEGEAADADDLVAAWRAGAAEIAPAGGASLEVPDDESFGIATPVTGAAAPQVASFLSVLDPRHALRMATVWMMKDRAGAVGTGGVHELVRDVLDACPASVHLIGHSYGCKVMLSAAVAGPLSRKVTSILLLQPAVSFLCFAVDADNNGHPGGYRGVLDRVVQPVLSTFSSRDLALTRLFHLAVRRKTDIGEQKIAGAPPSQFAALGGYGAGGLAPGEGREIDAHLEGDPYIEIAVPAVRVVSINGSKAISGHGDVSNLTTWWALCDQVRPR